MQGSDALSGNNTGTLPPLSNGQASEASHHGLVVHADVTSGDLWLDVGIALVIAVGAPLLLKKLLETEFATRIFHGSASSGASMQEDASSAKLGSRAENALSKPPHVSALMPEDFDFDA